MSDKLFKYSVVLKQKQELLFFAHKYDIDDGVLTFYRNKNLIASFNSNLWETCYLVDDESLKPIILDDLLENNYQENILDTSKEAFYNQNELPQNIEVQTLPLPLDKNNKEIDVELDKKDSLNNKQSDNSELVHESLVEESLDTLTEDLGEGLTNDDVRSHNELEVSLNSDLENNKDNVEELEKRDETSHEEQDNNSSSIKNLDSDNLENFEYDAKESEDDYFAGLDDSFKNSVLKEYSKENPEKVVEVINENLENEEKNISDNLLDELDLNDFDLIEDTDTKKSSDESNNLQDESTVTTEDASVLDDLDELEALSKEDAENLTQEEVNQDVIDDTLNNEDNKENNVEVSTSDDLFSSLDELSSLSDSEQQTESPTSQKEEESTLDELDSLSQEYSEEVIQEESLTHKDGNIEEVNKEDSRLEIKDENPLDMLDSLDDESSQENPNFEEHNSDIKHNTKEYSVEEEETKDALIEQENDRSHSDIDSIEELLAQLPDTQENSIYAPHFEQGNSEIRRVNASGLNKDFDAMDSLISKDESSDNKKQKESEEPKKGMIEKVVSTVEKIAKIDRKFGTPVKNKEDIVPEFRKEPEPEIVQKPVENPMIRNSQGRLLTPQELKIKKDKIIEKTILQYCSKYDNFNPNNLFKLLSNNTTAKPYGISENDIIWVATKMIKNYEVNVDKFSSVDIQNRLNFFLPGLMTLHWDGSMGNMYSVISEIPQLKDIILIDLAVWLVNNNY